MEEENDNVSECENGSPTCTPMDPCVVCYDSEDDVPECEGHYDDDRALLLGGPYYCDGSRVVGRE